MPVAAVAGSAVLGAAGNVASGIINANTANRAAKQQSRAIDKMKAYTEKNLDPEVLKKVALQADTERIQNQLALQAKIDPALAAQRGVAEQKISEGLAGVGTSASDVVAAQAAKEALATNAAGKQQLIEAALGELNAGAKLPPDLQAELMQAGLQKASGVTGGAGGAAGVSGSILSQVLGSAGLNLKAQREQQATQMLTAAGNLEQQRAQILQGLFPRLQQQQLGNLSAASGVLQQENALLPNAGLTGTQVASDWLARVGAINQLAGQQASVQAQGALATGQAKAGVAGAIASLGQAAAPGEASGISSFFNSGKNLVGASSGEFPG